MRGLIVLLVFLGVAVLAALIVSNNPQPVDINMLFTTAAGVPLWRAMGISFVSGGLLVALVLLWPYTRVRLRTRLQARQITRLEQEIHGLRTLPLPDQESGAQEG
jgi:uncharacterized membrane protein YciS (DUF1049 family)